MTWAMKTAKIIGVLALLPQLAFAWGDLGHETVAEIAQRHLTARGQKMMYDLIGTGPMAGPATWPDLVRSDKRFSPFAAYHFIEIDPRYSKYEDISERHRVKRDANSIIENVPEQLYKHFLMFKKFNKSQKQALISYLIHVVGDVHQPLHVGNGYDRGANFCEIRYFKSGTNAEAKMSKNTGRISTNLHSFWDSTVVEHIAYAEKKKNPAYKGKISGLYYAELANLIEQDPTIKSLSLADEKKIQTTPILEWYKEAQDLHPVVYPDAETYKHPEQRPYCRHIKKDGLGDPILDEKTKKEIVEPDRLRAEDIPTVSDDYMDKSAELVKMQIYKGGLRLAYLINQIAERQYGKLSPTKESKDLKEIMLENKGLKQK